MGGVMIWEVGQDCRLHKVVRDGKTHVSTCNHEKPEMAKKVSLMQ